MDARGTFRSDAPTRRAAFGPEFFVAHLKRFMRERCPEPHEALPLVTIHLDSGDVVHLCHVISVSPGFVALAAFDEDRSELHTMRTEILAYESIRRVVVREPPEHSIASPDLVAKGRAAETLLDVSGGRFAAPTTVVEWIRLDD